MYNSDEIKSKKLILYGTEKMQRDFAYIFEYLDIAYYIDQTSDNVNDESILNVVIENEGRDKILVIICTKNKTDLKHRLKSCGLEYLKSFVYANDLFPILDFDWRKLANGRKIVLWGTGVECDYFEKNTSLEQKYVEAYIDANVNKRGQVRNEKQILHPSDIKDLKQYFFIVTTLKYYEEICKQLTGMGLKEDLDFSNYRKECGRIGGGFIDKPSEMLLKTFYADSMNGPKCTQPFTDWNIQAGGNVCICGCPPWIHSKSIGTLAANSCIDIQNSMQAKIFRLSIINRTYSFCDHKLCKYFNSLEQQKKDVFIERFEDLKVKIVPDINVSIDSGCNLACRQCRGNYQLETEDFNKAVIPTILRRLKEDNWLNLTDVLNIAGSGEVFYNDSYKSLIFMDEDVKRDSIIIKSNGILFHEMNFDRIANIYRHIAVSISVDAATVKTYKLLRGDTWNALVNNLGMLSVKRSNNEITYFELTFCVQMDNVEEMEAFVKWAKELNVDKVIFQKMFKPEYMTNEEYQQYSCFDDYGNVKEKAQKIFKSVLFNNSVVDISQLQ